MAFRPITEITSGRNFNSQESSNFKDLYDSILINKYKEKESHKPSQTFAPSSFRCDRLSYFRIRGVEPDNIVDVDKALEFSAMIGTACHEEIQSNLKNALGDQWVDVQSYLESNPISHRYEISKRGQLETQIKFFNPPVKFSCDGILKIGEKFYLLEIKTSEYQSFQKLVEPKIQHIDQVKCYCSLLELHNAFVFYQDRVYGDTKCFEVYVSPSEMDEIYARMERVLKYVEDNIAPPRLDTSDTWCSYCKYKQRCKQWG